MTDPLFVAEAAYQADRARYMRMATPDQEVAVYDETDRVVMLMGGTYVIPDDEDSRRLREILALLRARVASGDVRASVLREVERVACEKSSPKS